MTLRIACDLDGTVADIDSALEREAVRQFGPRPDEQSGTRPPRALRTLWSRVSATENFWTTLDEIEPGAVRRLATAAAERGWEIIFLTQRPETAGMTAQRQSQQWLEAHGFERPSVFVVSGSRGKIAAALDLHVVVDDRPENCLDVVADSNAVSLLVWRRQPELVPPGVSRLRIEVVASMAEATQRLTQLDRVGSARRNMIERVRHALRPWWTSRPASASPVSVTPAAVGDRAPLAGGRRAY
jgi:hypothetical protein